MMATSRLSPDGEHRREAARRLVLGLDALAELVDLLDPDGRRSRWDVATDVAAGLRKLKRARLARIQAGNCAPEDRKEELLVAICDAPKLPSTTRNLFELIRPD